MNENVPAIWVRLENNKLRILRFTCKNSRDEEFNKLLAKCESINVY